MSNLLKPLVKAMTSACKEANLTNLASVELVTDQLYAVPVTEIVNSSLPCNWWHKTYESVRGGYALYIYFDQVQELHTLAHIHIPLSAKQQLKTLQSSLNNELDKLSIEAMLGMVFPDQKQAVNQ